MALFFAFARAERGAAQDRGSATYAFLEGKKVTVQLHPQGIQTTKELTGGVAVVTGTVEAVDQHGLKLAVTEWTFANNTGDSTPGNLYVNWGACGSIEVMAGEKRRR